MPLLLRIETEDKAGREWLFRYCTRPIFARVWLTSEKERFHQEKRGWFTHKLKQMFAGA